MLSDAHASIEDLDRIGLVGRNGCGKTSLLRVIIGETAPDSGDMERRDDVKAGYLPQSGSVQTSRTIREEMTDALSYMYDVQKRLREMEEKNRVPLGSMKDAPGLDRYSELRAFFETNGGYQLEAKIQSVLNGMGFAAYPQETPCSRLSGGERTRLALAKLLVQEPGFLILDEPTNHLDLSTLDWLEGYLSAYQGALLVVSHDRYFLDKVCTRIWDMEAGRLFRFRGNYSQAMRSRVQVFQQLQEQYDREEEEIQKLRDYTARNRYRAATAAQAQSRERKMEALLENHKPVPKEKDIQFRFPYPGDPVKDVLLAEGLTLRAGGEPEGAVLGEGIDLSIQRGEKIAFVGENGCGKSSFLKTLLRSIRPQAGQSGRAVWGKNVKLSYFEQGTEGLRGDRTALEELWSRFPRRTELEARSNLARLGFSHGDVFKLVRELSGGEKARLKLAVMIWQQGNVLILDEPTNHLDFQTCRALEDALATFEGTVLFVSHDRYFVDRVAGRIVEIRHGGWLSCPGKYEDLLRLRQTVQEETTEKVEKPVSQAAQTYRRGKKYRAMAAARSARIAAVEKEIAQIEQRQQDLQAALESDQADFERLAGICRELEELSTQNETLVNEWTELSAERELEEELSRDPARK